jgi:hypothetical protein
VIIHIEVEVENDRIAGRIAFDSQRLFGGEAERIDGKDSVTVTIGSAVACVDRRVPTDGDVRPGLSAEIRAERIDRIERRCHDRLAIDGIAR